MILNQVILVGRIKDIVFDEDDCFIGLELSNEKTLMLKMPQQDKYMYKLNQPIGIKGKLHIDTELRVTVEKVTIIQGETNGKY